MKLVLSVYTILGLYMVSAQRLNTPKRNRYVLSYDNMVSLDEVEAFVQGMGATVERQLGCTRGLVLSVDHTVSTNHIEEKPGMSLLPLELSHPYVSQVSGSPTVTPKGMIVSNEKVPLFFGCLTLVLSIPQF